jgi:hypothetical protein
MARRATVLLAAAALSLGGCSDDIPKGLAACIVRGMETKQDQNIEFYATECMVAKGYMLTSECAGGAASTHDKPPDLTDAKCWLPGTWSTQVQRWLWWRPFP